MRLPSRAAYVVVDLGFGDQGKGSVTDFLARDRGAHTVVRFNGGAQAGHNVVTPDGRHHTFAQFGAASFVPGVETFLTRYMVLQPQAMVVEAEHLARVGVPDAFARTRIARGATVITPFHRAANRLRERLRARDEGRHGSCGVGVGEAVHDALTQPPEQVVTAGELEGRATLAAKLLRIQERKRDELADVRAALVGDADARDDLDAFDDPRVVAVWIDMLAPFTRAARLVDDDALGDVLARPGSVVFEGAQGVLLDEWRGFHPYTTWSTCTDANAATLLTEQRYDGDVLRLGLVRAYATRHGAGPFVTESAELTARVPDRHNSAHPWQGGFRVGHFDAVATRYAMRCCARIDGLVVSCLDRLADAGTLRVATAYRAEETTLRELPMGTFGDLDHQSRLTAYCQRAEPVYDNGHDTVETLVEAIAAQTTDVALLSYGPSATEKGWR